jgi:hypothetical protein
LLGIDSHLAPQRSHLTRNNVHSHAATSEVGSALGSRKTGVENQLLHFTIIPLTPETNITQSP